MTPKGAWPRSRVLLLKQWDRYPRSTERISCCVIIIVMEVNYALQLTSMSDGGLHLDLSVHRDSLAKTEFVLPVPSLMACPVAESFVHTSKEEKLPCKDENLVVNAEQYTVPLMSTSVVAGQHMSSVGSLNLSAGSVPSLVPSARCKTESTDVLLSSFCPMITDVRSVKMEPESDYFVPLSSSVVLSHRGVSVSNVKSQCDQMEKLTVTECVQCNNVHCRPSNTNSCVTSDCSSSSSLVSCSLASLRPPTSFAGSTPSGMTSTAVADHHVSHSIASAAVKQEFSSTKHRRLSSENDLLLPSNCAQLSVRNLTESSDFRSSKFTDSELPARCRVPKAEVVGGCGLRNLHKSSKTVANSADIVSAVDTTLLPHTNVNDGRKCSYSKATNVDGSVKGKHLPSAGRQKSDTKPQHDAVTFQSGKECKLSSVTPNVESSKRKFQTMAKTGMYVYCY